MDAVFGDHMGEEDERSKAAIRQGLLVGDSKEEGVMGGHGSDREDEKFMKSDAFVESV